MVRIAVLVSGGGTNFQALIDFAARGELSAGVLSLCISSKEDVFALERAKKASIPSLVISPQKFSAKESYSNEILKALEKHEIDLVVLAGFLSVLEGPILSKYKDKIINVHPSLIPSFCGEGCYGLKVHQMALASGVKVTGATVHLVDAGVDSGKILSQKPVYIKENDTPESLQKRVMEEAEWLILPQAVSKLCEQMEDCNI